MRVSKLFLAVLTASLSTAALAGNIDFTTNGLESGTAYTGAFVYGGVIYGPNTAVSGTDLAGNPITIPPITTSINTDSLPKFIVHGSPTLGTAGPSTITSYKLYAQDYSFYVGNVSRFTAAPFGFVNTDTSFTKEYGGTPSTASAIPSGASYTYNGPLFTPASIGTFSYTITESAGSLNGSGTAQDGALVFALNSKPVVVSGGKLGVTAGNVSITAGVPDKEIMNNTGLKYNLTVYGPAAEEVVGKLYGLHPNNSTGEVNDYGFAGSRLHSYP